jgi:hypothetical protein
MKHAFFVQFAGKQFERCTNLLEPTGLGMLSGRMLKNITNTGTQSMFGRINKATVYNLLLIM